MALEFERNGRKKPAPAKKKRSRNLSFYAAVVLCAGAVALTVAANSSHGDKQETTGTQQTAQTQSSDLTETVDRFLSEEWPVAEDEEPAEIQPAAVTTTTAEPAPVTTAPSRLAVTDPADSEEAVAAAAPLRFSMPGSGAVTSGFSGDELVFCATMGDWRIHNGIDISGSAGDQVLACADGIVEDFAADMLYGNTAVIRHADDSVIYYSGLSDTQMVSAGLHVKAGDVIGYIGEVPCELEDGPHIHLTMVKDGKFIDPAPLLSGR